MGLILNKYQRQIYVLFVLISCFISIKTYSKDQAVGTITGDLSVDANGASKYSIPIEVPPGTNGAAPSLSLEYNSQSGNGLLGVGWSLSGFTSIARCGQSWAQDGHSFKPGVNYKYSDRYCMDGQRLISIDGDYGKDNTKYRTEIETWTDIRSYGNTDNGPKYFIATTKNGAVIELGRTDDSRLLADVSDARKGVRVWAVNKITDRNGNVVEVDYTKVKENEHYPTVIRYSSNTRTGAEARRKILFEYKERGDKLTHFAGGAKLKQKARLSKIKTFVDNNLVKRYELSYQTSKSTYRSLLSSVKECGPNTCLPPTKFSWANGEYKIEEFKDYIGGDFDVEDDGLVPSDVNGDGREDLIWFVYEGDGKTSIKTLLSDGKGSWSKSTKTISKKFKPQSKDHDTLIPADINGDGLSDIIWAYNDDGSDGDFSVRSVIAKPDGGWDIKNDLIDKSEYDPDDENRLDKLFPGDINGDGLTDLLWVHAEGSKGIWLKSIISEGNGEWKLAHKTGISAPFKPFGKQMDQLRPGDINGDGILDLIWTYNDDGDFRVRTIVGQGTGEWKESKAKLSSNTFKPYTESHDRLLLGDVNGDGSSDLVWVFNKNEEDLSFRTYLSEGNGDWHATDDQKFSGSFSPGKKDYDELHLADTNSDGLSDIILSYNRSGDNGDFTLRIFTSLGNGKWKDKKYDADAEREHYDPDSDKQDTLLTMDSNGDGLAEIVWVYSDKDGDNFKINTKAINLDGTKAANINDVITKIESGHNFTSSINYQRLTNSKIYTKESNAVGKTSDIQPPLAVVEFYQHNDKRSQYQYHYRYVGAKKDRNRGWLGFHKVLSTNPTGLTSSAEYYQSFPHIGIVKSKETYLSDSKKRTGISTYSYRYNKNDDVYRVHLHSETHNSYYLGTFKFVKQTFYSYDQDYKNVVYRHDVGDLADSNDDIYYCTFYRGGELWQNFSPSVSIVKKSPGKCDDKDTDFIAGEMLSLSRFEYDSRMNLIKEKHWSDQHNAWAATSYEYDSFGNRVAETNPEGHRFTTKYDEQYHTFPVKQSTPFLLELGQSLTTTAAFDPKFGVQTRASNASGIWDYYIYPQDIDEFGRVRKIYGTEPASGVLEAVQEIDYALEHSSTVINTRTKKDWGSDAQVWPWQKEFIDGFGRTFKTHKSHRHSAVVATETAFDPAGRVWRESFPHFLNGNKAYIYYAYDRQGNLTKTTSPDGLVKEVTYDTAGKRKVIVKQIDPRAEAGNMEYLETELDYDSRGNLIKETAPGNATTYYHYDLLGRIKRKIDPQGVESTFVYDSLGNLIKTYDPIRGKMSSNHDLLGNILTTKNDWKQTTENAYDELGRITYFDARTARGEIIEQTSYRYDESRYGLGRISAIEHDNIAYDYDYNRNGQMISKTSYWDQHELYTPIEENYEYNAAGQLQKVGYPDGSTTIYRYTNGNLLKKVLHQQADEYFPTEIVKYQQHSPFGIAQEVIYNNGTVTNIELDTQGRMTFSGTTQNALEHLAYQYKRNASGKLSKITDRRATYEGPSLSQTFHYNKFGNLKQADSKTYGSLHYQYDNAGNIMKDFRYRYTYHQDKPHQLEYMCFADEKDCGEHNYHIHTSYNSLGNIKKKSVRQGDQEYTHHYQFDSIGRLTKVRKSERMNGSHKTAVLSSFIYGIDNERLIKTDRNNKQTLYLSPNYELVRDASGEVLTHTKYIHGERGVIMAITGAGDGFGSTPSSTPVAQSGYPSAGETLYFHNNHLGSTVLITDPGGAEFSRVAYEPFGQKAKRGNSGGKTFRASYTGKEYDQDIGLYYFGSRYYDAEVGRFISPDPAVQYASPYIYGASDPIGHIDPDGEFAITTGLVVGIAVGAVIGGTTGGYFGGQAVNDSFNPLDWDWKSGKTWAGIGIGGGVGAFSGAVSGGILSGGITGTAATVLGTSATVAEGASEGIFTGLNGGSASDIVGSAAMGIGLGFAMEGGGVLARRGMSKIGKFAAVKRVMKSANKYADKKLRAPSNALSSPAGITFGRSGDRAMDNLAARADIDPDGYLDVVAHGYQSRILVNQRGARAKWTNARDIAQRIRESPDWQEGRPIRLLSCNVGRKRPFGKNNFAQKLANELQVEVFAPKSFLMTKSSGEYYVTSGIRHLWRKKKYPWGFKTFSPQP